MISKVEEAVNQFEDSLISSNAVIRALEDADAYKLTPREVTIFAQEIGERLKDAIIDILDNLRDEQEQE